MKGRNNWVKARNTSGDIELINLDRIEYITKHGSDSTKVHFVDGESGYYKVPFDEFEEVIAEALGGEQE